MRSASVHGPFESDPAHAAMSAPARGATTAPTGAEHERDPFLAALGDRVRSLRASRGLTRKALAKASDVSERHLANLELGTGNASVLVLRQIAQALGCPIAELLGDETAGSPEWLLIRELLRGRPEEELRRGRLALSSLYGRAPTYADRHRRVALLGLRGAGKSTLGRRLAEHLDVPFLELRDEIERLAGCEVSEIHNLYGPTAYRRYERRALEETERRYPEAVLATPGGIISDSGTFALLLSHWFTVWLRASPEQHMTRVIDQGDLRPMAGNREAMGDLRRILSARGDYYRKADLTIDTGAQGLEPTFARLRDAISSAQVTTSATAR